MIQFSSRCSLLQCMSIGGAILSLGLAVIWSGATAHTKVDTVVSLTERMLIERIRPAFITPPESFSQDLTVAGLYGFACWKQRYGNETISLGEDSDFEIEVRRMGRKKVSTYIDALLEHQQTNLDLDRSEYFGLRLSESWGSHWLLSHPELVQALSKIFTPFVPSGFREGMHFSDEELRHIKKQEALEEHSYVLWAGPAGYEYSLHMDLVSGTLLTHLDGRKTVWLYPPSHAKYLYLESKETNWEAISPVNPLRPDFLRFPLFALARPIVINLNKGDVLFVPCGWPHFVIYEEAAISLGINMLPDWLDELEGSCTALGKQYSPRSCSDLLTQPALPTRC